MKKTLLLAVLIGTTGCLLLAQAPLDPTNFVVVGGGWAAGYGNFELTADLQKYCFPKLMAGSMETIMPLPGVRRVTHSGILSSFDPLPRHLARVSQSGVRVISFPLFTFNLSVPFITVSEALNRRPAPVPGDKLYLLDEDDLKQSLLNLVAGYPELILDDPIDWTMAEYAERMAPTLVLVQLGFGDALQAALQGDPSLLTPAGQFSSSYSTLVDRMVATFATVVLLDVPNPTETAYFSTLEEVAARYDSTPEILMERFALQPGDLITLGGLLEIGEAFTGRGGDTLSTESVLRAAVVEAVADVVAMYNTAINDVASAHGLRLFQLGAFAGQVNASGVAAGSFLLQGEYLEGFYSRDGLFPGPSGQAVLANELIQFINGAFGTSFPGVDAEAIAREDDLVPKTDSHSSPEGGVRPLLRRGWTDRRTGRQ